MRALRGSGLTVEEEELLPEEPGEAALHKALEGHKVIAEVWDKQVDWVKVAAAHKGLAPERTDTVEAFLVERVAVVERLAAEPEQERSLDLGGKAVVEAARSGVVAATRASAVAVEEVALPSAVQVVVITVPGVGACFGLIGCRPIYLDEGSSYRRDFLVGL